MKTVKKAFSVLLALLIVFSAVSVASAAEISADSPRHLLYQRQNADLGFILYQKRRRFSDRGLTFMLFPLKILRRRCLLRGRYRKNQKYND